MGFPQDISLAVDAVVFGYSREQKSLSILLIERGIEPFKGQWALPGGFVRDGESLERAVTRELEQEAGVRMNYLEQLYTFGSPDRDPRYRVVSVAYFGLVKPDHYKLHAASDAADAQWFEIHNLPPLAFDHATVLETAITRLKGKVTYEPLGFELLDETARRSNSWSDWYQRYG